MEARELRETIIAELDLSQRVVRKGIEVVPDSQSSLKTTLALGWLPKRTKPMQAVRSFMIGLAQRMPWLGHENEDRILRQFESLGTRDGKAS